jgi:hypothetical protein
MAKRRGQQLRQININVSEEQWLAVQEALVIAQSKATKASKNDILLVGLVALCDTAGVEFPAIEKRQGERTDLKSNP